MSSRWLYGVVRPVGDVHVEWTDDRKCPPSGARILVQVKTPRSAKQHRLYWAMLRNIVDATGQWKTADDLHRWIKVEIGHFRKMAYGSGECVIELLPTDFASMEQGEFQSYFDRAVAAIVFETGIDPLDIYQVKELINENS